MPLVNGKFEDGEYPSKKHVRVLFDNSKAWRFRVLYGGRNGYKDWSYAQAAIERGIRKSTGFLFTREVQLTIADSAHKLLCDTIKRLGYQQYYTITNSKITCNINDTFFIFRGLNDLVSDDIKSTEGIDICVICEAQNLTEKSATDLFPTIRKAGSEIWIMFNTKLESDYVYQLCVVNPPDNMICDRVNYTDTNAPEKMLSQVIIDEAERMKAMDYKKYEHVWLGMPSLSGLFFSSFGDHNRILPFVIGDQDDNSRIFGSLDHGIAHNTSFGLWYLDPDGTMYRVFTYSNNGGTTRSHAEAIVESIGACRFTRYMFPNSIYFDYAMNEKHQLNEYHYKSDLDEYKEVFGASEGGKDTVFIPANKRKIDGCHAMHQVFANENGQPIFRYFDGLNDKLIDSLKSMVTDDIEPEIYSKIDGDDETDECRYGIMGIVAHSASLKTTKKKQAALVLNIERPMELARTYGGLS